MEIPEGAMPVSPLFWVNDVLWFGRGYWDFSIHVDTYVRIYDSELYPKPIWPQVRAGVEMASLFVGMPRPTATRPV